MPLDSSAQLVVDFDKGNVDLKVIVLAGQGSAGMGYDLTITRGGAKKVSEVFFHPKSMCAGRYVWAGRSCRLGLVFPGFKFLLMRPPPCVRFPVSRMIELEDLPPGSALSDMAFSRYTLTEPVTMSLADVVRLR